MDENKEPAPFIPLCVPQMGGNEWQYVKECLDTHWVSYVGSYVDRFEKELSEITGARYCVATNSGTSALHLALTVLGIERDSEVIMPAISFVAPANAIRYCNAWPTLIDLDPNTWQIDINKLEDFLAKGCERKSAGQLVNRTTGRVVSALLPVHLFGGMAEVRPLAELATRFDLPLIEDAAECLGARYLGQPIASPIEGFDPKRRIVITSFNGNKIITTGGGGALMCDDQNIAARAKHISTTAKTDAVEFHHDVVGYNYRLSNVLAAIGVGQIELLDQYLTKKREIARRYEVAFSGEEIEIAPEIETVESTYWMYTVRVGAQSRKLIDWLNTQKVQVRPVWHPIARLPVFEECYAHAIEFADQFYRTSLSIPCSVTLSESDQTRVIDLIRQWLAEARDS